MASYYRDIPQRVAIIACVTILIGAFFTCIMLMSISAGFKEIVYNSDLLQPYMVTHDIMRDLRAVSTWNHSPALYLFPDWVLATLLNLLPVENVWLPVLAAPLMWLGYACGGGAIYAVLGRTSFATGTLITALLIGSIWILDLAIWPETFSSWYLSNLSSPFIHTGAIISVLFSIRFFLASWQRPLRLPYTIVSVLLIMAATLSDPIFVLWFVVPAISVISIDAILTSSIRRWRLASIISLPSFLVYAVESRYNVNRANYMHSDISISQSAKNFLDHISETLRSGDLIFYFLIAGSFAFFLSAVFAIRRCAIARYVDTHHAFDLFAAIAIAAMFAGPIAKGLFTVSDHWRYYLLLPILLTIWVVTHLPLKFGSRRTLLVALSFGLGMLPVAGSARSGIKILNRPDALVACIEGEGRKIGLGDYWTAKKTMFLSEYKLRMIQVGTDGGLYTFNYNTTWGRDDTDPSQPAIADFIVMTRLDRQQILRVHGTPNRMRRCGSETIWLYDHPLDYQVFLPPKALIGAAGLNTVSVASLDSNTGRIEGIGRSAAEGDDAGLLSYGPYAWLQAGSYQIDVQYASTGLQRWSLDHAQGSLKLADGQFYDTKGVSRTLTIPITISPQEIRDVEFRPYYTGKGSLTVTTIRIRPIRAGVVRDD